MTPYKRIFFLKLIKAELDVKLLLYAIQRTTVFEEQLSKRYTGVTINGTSEMERHESTNPFEEQGSDYNSEGNPDGSNSQSELSETKLDKKLEQKKNNPFNKDCFECYPGSVVFTNLWLKPKLCLNELTWQDKLFLPKLSLSF